MSYSVLGNFNDDNVYEIKKAIANDCNADTFIIENRLNHGSNYGFKIPNLASKGT